MYLFVFMTTLFFAYAFFTAKYDTDDYIDDNNRFNDYDNENSSDNSDIHDAHDDGKES